MISGSMLAEAVHVVVSARIIVPEVLEMRAVQTPRLYNWQTYVAEGDTFVFPI
jgi:hypothetical protein